MIGLIVTGHGSFASGLTSGLKLLAGDPEQYEAVDFDPEDSIDMLEEKLKSAVARLGSCDGILVMTDLCGGSPFNVSSRLSMASGGSMEVLGGTNLPMLLETYMSRPMAEELASLAEAAVNAGKSQVMRFVKPVLPAAEDDDDELEID